MRRVALCLAVAVTSCTKPNPRACSDGTCTDPAYPFCDLSGTLGGEQNECIAVECTPGAIAECRGTQAVVCNEAGTNFDVLSCTRGCDTDRDGCLVEPSNGLGAYIDMVESPSDLTVITGVIDTHTGTIDGDGTFPSFLVPAPEGGAPIRVFVAKRVRLGEVSVEASTFGGFGPALAIVATDSITIEASVSLRSAPSAAYGPPGGLGPPTCPDLDGLHSALIDTNTQTAIAWIDAGAKGEGQVRSR